MCTPYNTRQSDLICINGLLMEKIAAAGVELGVRVHGTKTRCIAMRHARQGSDLLITFK